MISGDFGPVFGLYEITIQYSQKEEHSVELGRVPPGDFTLLSPDCPGLFGRIR